MKPFLAVLTGALLAATAQAADWTDPITYGSHPVGFETIATVDYARRYKAAGADDLGPRPMPIGVWYPADSNDGTPLTAAYLVALGAAAETPDGVDPDDTARIDRAVQDFAPTVDGNFAPLAPTFHARYGAHRANGSFPLVLYAAAQGSDGYGNARLCEVLASHGFIVATVASKGAYSRSMPFNAEGAEAQFRDLEFVYGALHDYPHVQHDNVSVFGFSFGGLNMVPFALRHRAVRAMVALDGSIPPGLDIVLGYDYLDLSELRTPLLAFIGDKTGIADFEPLLTRAPLAEAYLVETANLVHFAFASVNLNLARNDPYERDAFVAMADLTVAFIRQNARDEGNFDALLAARDQKIFPVMRHRQVQAEPRVGRDEFIAFVHDEGLDAAIAVYQETKRDFPDYRLFEYGAFRDVGYLRMQQQKYDEAVKAFRVLIDAYPDEADSHRRLGEALMMAGQFDEARGYLTRGLEIDPDSPALKDILRILDEKVAQR